MGVPCKIYPPGSGGWRELLFEFEPRVGDIIRLPEDGGGNQFLQVVEVVHDSAEVHGNSSPSVRFYCKPAKA